MPPPKKPTLLSQVRAHNERVSHLEEVSQVLYKFVGAQNELNKTMEKLINELIPSGSHPAADWLKQGEALLEQDENEKQFQLLMKRFQEVNSRLLDAALDLALATRKPPKSASSNEAE